MRVIENLAGHFRDLAQRSYTSNMYTFSEFLGEGELDLLMRLEKELSYAGLTLSGGIPSADRVVARFGRPEDLGYEEDFPIVCLKIEPVIVKFGEELSHRDYLGALMSLGIERDLLGDIRINEKTAYLFCMDHIADYIIRNLTSVRHTNVRIAVMQEIPEAAGPRFENQTIIAASERLDAVIARLYNLARSKSQDLFRSEKVFVNGKQCENSSLVCKAGDKISVRGFGKFVYLGSEGLTGKGRSRISVNLYR